MKLAALALVLVACVAPQPAVDEPLRIAACQILVDGDRAATFDRIDAAMAEAKQRGAQLACFPEACLFGWVNPTAHELADPIPGPTTDRLAQLARKHDMLLLVGLAERNGDKLHNAAVLIDRDGALLVHHRKLNILSELMDPPYTPGVGASDSWADTSHGRIGVLICADTFQDETVAQLASAQPDLVLVPYGWAAPVDAWPDHGQSLHAWIAHTAKRLNAPVLGVDAVGALAHGPWQGYPLGGQSAMSDAAGNLSEPLADRAPEVHVFEVPATGRY